MCYTRLSWFVYGYNFERLANKLKRTERFNDWTKPIKEAYFPKLYSAESSREWPGRVANETLKDVARENPQQYIKLDSHNETIELTEEKGIDILGNIVEATILSPNPDLYGNLHNMGHNFIASVHDPDFRNLEPLAVMGFTDTAMRDTIFYRWHAYIDHIFQEHKARLPQYDEKRLNFPGITVSEIEVQSEGATKTNILKTFWQKSDIDLSGGMNFQPRGPIFIKFKHLQHHPFTYKITVNNNNNGNKPGTCRIFLAPKFDERNDPWLFRDQKNMMFIELDKFTVSLKQGKNTITRASDQSSVTIPFETIFGTSKLPEGSPASKRSPLCGCGWPQHMLIPKGTAEGMPCELFVMISDYENDKINQSTEGECNDGASYCGIKDKLYPDRQSMGFPFDRMPRAGVRKLQQFLTPNMRVQDVTIQFSDGIPAHIM